MVDSNSSTEQASTSIKAVGSDGWLGRALVLESGPMTLAIGAQVYPCLASTCRNIHINQFMDGATRPSTPSICTTARINASQISCLSCISIDSCCSTCSSSMQIIARIRVDIHDRLSSTVSTRFSLGLQNAVIRLQNTSLPQLCIYPLRWGIPTQLLTARSSFPILSAIVFS